MNINTVILLVVCVLADKGQGYLGYGEECGVKPVNNINNINKRIVGGSEASENEWPWQVQINHPPFVYKGESVPGRTHICGGALIRKDWVLTAAHCLKPQGKWAWWSETKRLTVILGEHQRDTSSGREQRIRVSRILVHSAWDYRTNHNDIALLQLEHPAQLNKEVGTVCIPEPSVPIYDGKQCWVAGWGLSQVGSTPVNSLHELRVSLASKTRCLLAFSRYGVKNIGDIIEHPSVLCAGRLEIGKGTCHGDSGGPMVCESQGRWYMEGIVSWGLKGCSDKQVFDGYTSVRYFRDWITNVVNRFSDKSKYVYEY